MRPTVGATSGVAPSAFRGWWRRLVTLTMGCLLLLGGTPAAAQNTATAPKTGTILGTVIDAADETRVVGARVEVLGTARVTYTSSTGAFRLGYLRPGTYQVQINTTGYRTMVQEVTVPADGIARPLIRLSKSAIALDELVVTGRSRTSTRAETGAAVATIQTAPLDAALISNMSQLLQSRVPGMNVLPSGGKPGQGSRIILRGVRSIARDFQPLILVDGVRIDNSAINGLHGRLGTRHIGGESWAGIDDLNPDDVDRIEVLRGPAAATLYGSEGAGGVINIITKQGVGDRQRFTFRSEYGVNDSPRGAWQITPSSDWFYDNYVRRGTVQNHIASVRGSADRFSYYAGASLRRDEGVLPQSGTDHWTFRANMRAMPKQSIAISVNTGFSLREVDLPYDGVSNFGLARNGLLGGELGVTVSPDEILTYDVGLKASRFTAGATIEQVLTPKFGQRVTLGADIFNTDNIDYNPYGTLVTEGGKKISHRRHSTILTVDYRGSFEHAFSPTVHTTTTVGAQGLSREQAYTMALGYNFAGPGLSTVETAGTTDGDEDRKPSRAYGFYLTEAVGIGQRLFLTAGVRFDKHSAFGPNRGFEVYPSASVSYLLSDHDFLPSAIGTLRLRAAYGKAGQQPGEFASKRTWISVPASGDAAGMITGNIGNPNLGAEVSTEIEGGFDAGLLDDRVIVEFTYYRQRTDKALYPVYDAPSAGFPDPQLYNAAQIDNSGIELSAQLLLADSRNLRWSVRGALFTNENRVEKIGIGDPLHVSGAQWVRPGYPVAAFFTEDGEYIGPAFPTKSIQLSTELRLFDRLTLAGLLDHRGGNYLESYTLRDIVNAGQAIPQLGTLPGNYIFPADFWRLREVSLSYRLPERWLRPLRASGAEFTLAGRNLWSSFDYPGLEVEAYAEALQLYMNQVSFSTPLPRQIVAGFGLKF